MPKKLPKKVLARVMVRPPARGSEGAVTIRQLLEDKALLVKRDAVPKQYRVVINWGNSAPVQAAAGVRVLNKPEAIARAVNKLATFTKLREAGTVTIPNFTTEAPRADRIWFARTKLAGSGGEGIVVIRPEDVQVPAAPLYVEYVKKVTEYRIHVVNGAVIFAQAKKKRAGFEQDADDKLIRNYENGWVFCPVELGEVPANAQATAINALAALELDFGAVDLVIGRGDGIPYFLEVNTAPGIESPTLKEAYKNAFSAMVA